MDTDGYTADISGVCENTGTPVRALLCFWVLCSYFSLESLLDQWACPLVRVKRRYCGLCASPCVGEHTRLWLSAPVGHFMSLCVNRNEILEEWPFSRVLFSFYTLVSERQYSRASFFFFFFSSSMSSGFPGERFVHESVSAGIDARSSQFLLTSLTRVELVPPYIQCNQVMSWLCATMWIQAWKGGAPCSW